MGFILVYVLPVVFAGVLVYVSILVLQVMQADLLSTSTSFWWRWLCGGGITAIVIVYIMVAKTIFVNHVWLPWKNRYLTKPRVSPPNHGVMNELEEWLG
jgi:hypothetical protein